MTNLNLGLSISDVVAVNVSLTPTAAAERNFGSLLILGDSYYTGTAAPFIDVVSRYRLYTSLTAVAGDFSTAAPEYLAAAIAFGQNPQLSQLYIGFWARAATSGTLIGGVLSAIQQNVGSFTGTTNAGASFFVDGTIHNLSGLNFSAVTSLAQVATIITAAFAGAATCIWNANNGFFEIFSNTSGTSSSVGFGTTYGAGTNLNALINTASSQGGYIANGIAAETPQAALTLFAQMSNSWYGVMFAVDVLGQNILSANAWADAIACAAFIQGASPSHILGFTTQEAAALSLQDSSSLAYQLSQLGYSRTFVQYSSSSPYACAAVFGLAFTCNFNGTNTLYTMKFDVETGVVPETLTETQAAALNQTNCNVFVNYNVGKAILQQGQMTNGTFFDVIHGTDWLQNAIQTAVFSLLYTVGTKIPQTDAGVTQIINTITQELNQAVANDLVAPGAWNGPPIGAIVTGQTLSTGYYVYAPPVSTQSQAARSARQAPVITACIKLAGAIHSVSVTLNVNY